MGIGSITNPPVKSVDSFQRDNGSIGGQPCPVNDIKCRRQDQVSRPPSSSPVAAASPAKKQHQALPRATVPTTFVNSSRFPQRPNNFSTVFGVSVLVTAPLPSPIVGNNSSRSSFIDRGASSLFQTSTSRSFPSATIVNAGNIILHNSSSTELKSSGAVLPASSSQSLVTSSPRVTASGRSSANGGVQSTSSSSSTTLPTMTLVIGAVSGAVVAAVLVAVVAFVVCRYRSRERGTYNLDAATTINGYAYEPCDTTITVGIPITSTSIGASSTSAATSGGSSSPPRLPPPPQNSTNGCGLKGRAFGRRRSKSIGNGGSSTAPSLASSSTNGVAGSLGRRTTPRTKKVVREWYV